MAINHSMIEANLFDYIQTQMGATPVNTGMPLDFDPDTTQLESWLEIPQLSITNLPSTRNNRSARVVVDLVANAKSHDSMYAASKLLDSALQALTRQVVYVYDYDTSNNTQIGYVVFREPDVSNVTRDVWQTKQATLEGYYHHVLPE